MFSQVSVCPQGGGVCPITCWDTPLTRGRHPPGTRGIHPPGTRGRHPCGTKDRHPPWTRDRHHQAGYVLHVSVILFTGGVCPSACWDTPQTRGRHPEADNPQADTPWVDTLRVDTHPGQTLAPCVVHAGRCGQQAGGTHPIGMNSCYVLNNKSAPGPPIIIWNTGVIHTVKTITNIKDLTSLIMYF